MDILHALMLGIFQGITEFLPISSSGHLVLAEYFFSLPVEDLIAFDAILHGGSLAALIAVFHRELKRFWHVIRAPKKAEKEDKKLLLWLILATIPTLVFGYLGSDSLEIFRTPNGTAGGFVFCALFFIAAERFPKKKSEITTKRSAFLSALFQVIALLPGVSRSGMVTAAGMLSGTSRKEATRFAFLMGIPVIAAVFAYSLLQIFLGKTLFSLSAISIGIGFLSSAISGFFMAKFLLRFFAKHTLYPFAVYLILLAIIVFAWGN